MNQTKNTLRIFNGMSFPIPGEYTIDPMHSFTSFIAQHLVVGQVWGGFESIKGKITIADDPTLSSIDISIDTASISTHNERRDEDIRSARFLDVKKFPTMTYHSTGVIAEPRGHLTIEGNYS